MRHQALPVLTERDDGEFEVDPARILRHQLMNLRHMHKSDGKKLNAFVGVLQKVLDPFHRLGVEEEVGPFHELVAAKAPELRGVGRLPADVLEDELPILIAGLRRIERFAVGVVEFVTEFTFDRTVPAKTQGNFPRVHFPDEHLPIVGTIFEDRSRLKNGKRGGHG